MPASTVRQTQFISHSGATLEHLRERIAKIEGRGQVLSLDSQAAAWTTGHGALDASLGGKLETGGLHEIIAASPVDLTVASSFAFGLLARLPRHGPLLWCTNAYTQNEHGALYAPGLTAFGIDPSRIIIVAVRHPRDLSFVLEEAGRLSSLAAIFAEGPLASFTASRRLALILAASTVPMLYVADGKSVEGSAAATRMVVAPLAVENPHLNAIAHDIRSPGPPAFRVTLARTRGGRPGLQFETVFDHATLSFAPLNRTKIDTTSLSGVASDGVSDRQLSVGIAPERQRRA